MIRTGEAAHFHTWLLARQIASALVSINVWPRHHRVWTREREGADAGALSTHWRVRQCNSSGRQARRARFEPFPPPYRQDAILDKSSQEASMGCQLP